MWVRRTNVGSDASVNARAHVGTYVRKCPIHCIFFFGGGIRAHSRLQARICQFFFVHMPFASACQCTCEPVYVILHVSRHVLNKNQCQKSEDMRIQTSVDMSAHMCGAMACMSAGMPSDMPYTDTLTVLVQVSVLMSLQIFL